ncbi:MAG TPA: NAD(P)-dependent oxidoreductase [Vicinamibacterales bacterium]|jgi:2-hydroxy-3-oxopropionate reductase|nr:NAD(P)-dependent oxidoreductase [Vicinamibacterales bacterium]
MAELGFIGLGAMGTPMARNLLKAGHRVTVFARRKQAMEPLLADGAQGAASPADVASQSSIVFTMVSDTTAVEEVVLGKHGVREGARPGSVLIDHTTIAPAATRAIAAQLKARDIAMLDAPVSGGVAAAGTGTLSVMVGGEEPVFDACKPILGCVGQTIVYIGASGAGQIAKACNQICTIVNQEAAAEAMLLAEKCGVDPLKVQEVLMAGFAASRMLGLQAPKMIARNFEGKVESRLHHKDIQIVLEMARGLGIELPASAAAAEVLTNLQRRGGAKNDSAAVFTVLSDP